jgi:hypothetical protein
MSLTNPIETGVQAGQLSPDGTWVWDGSGWEPALSPDGQWRWDGTTWVSVGNGTPAPAVDVGALPSPDDIDSAQTYATGSLPPKVGNLPSDPLVDVHGLAIGRGWVARRPATSWHLINLDHLRSVAVVPPTAWKQWEYSRSMFIASPDLALTDQAGSTIRIPVSKLDQSGREAIRTQIPATSDVTPAGRQFLDSGSVPGKWGKNLQIGPWRFG